MSTYLPATWAMAPLGDLGALVGGGTPSKNNPSFWIDGTIPWVSPKDFSERLISDAEDYITQEALENSSTNIIPEGSVLIVVRSGILANSLPIAINTRPVAINQDVKAFVPSEGVRANYIAAALQHFSQEILNKCSKSGTTVPSILTPALRNFEIPLPPTDEQDRVVEMIDTLIACVSRATKSLSAIPELLVSCQATMFRTAFRGALARLETNDDFRAEGAFSDDASYAFGASSERTVTEFSDELIALYGVPQAFPWRFVTLDSLCDPARTITYGIIQTGDETDDGVPTVRAGDIKNFAINLTALKRVRKEIANDYPRTMLRGGEVLISIRGTTGNVAVAGWEMAGMNVSREVAVIPVTGGTEAKFVAYALSSPAGQEIINRHVKGVAQSGINLRDLRQFPIPFLAQSEQREIVNFIDCGLSRLNGLHTRMSGIRKLLGDLGHTIFDKGLRGELTSADPGDEPATHLIERSRALLAAPTPRRNRPKPELSQASPSKRFDVHQTRKDVRPDHLQQLVLSSERKALPVKELFLRAAMDIDEFYKQLAAEIGPGKLRQSADKAHLELADASR